MKQKLFILSAATFLFMACNNNAKTTNEASGDTIDAYRQVGVENVNGNLPDTTDAIDLSTNKDSTQVKDTMP